MHNAKEMAFKCLDTLYNATGQTPVDKTMYNELKKFLENSNIADIKQTEEYLKMENQLFVAKQLNEIYKIRINRAATILSGRKD
jgi:hypothetical protein